MGGAMSGGPTNLDYALHDLNRRLRKVENTNILLILVALVMTALNIIMAARVLSLMAVLGVG